MYLLPFLNCKGKENDIFKCLAVTLKCVYTILYLIWSYLGPFEDQAYLSCFVRDKRFNKLIADLSHFNFVLKEELKFTFKIAFGS